MTAEYIQANSSNYTPGRTRAIDRCVLHYTGGNGDTAKNNGKYFQGENRKASAHYFVDEDSIVLSVKETDTAWHAGNWDMNCRSIGIEMCSKKDAEGNYYIPAKTVANAVKLTKQLMEKYNIPTAGVIRHYDVNAKKCPEPFVRNPALWEDFRKQLTVPEKKVYTGDRKIVKERSGVDDNTMAWMETHRFPNDFFRKLANAMK